MKAIIYAGIGLFSVATIYGMADYYSTQKKGTLDKLYKEEVVPAETEKTVLNTNVIQLNAPETNSANKLVSKAFKKAKHPKRTIRLEEFSRGRIVEPMPVELVTPVQPVKEEPKKTEEIKLIDLTSTKVTELVKPDVIKKDPPRKLSLDMFSRAPLRDPVKKDKQVKIN